MSLKRKLLWASVAVVAALGASSYVANRVPHTVSEIEMLTDRLFEFGAVDFVHGAYDGPEAALFDCVAKGQILSQAQSIRYRLSYQALLLDKQTLFTALDQNIELRRDEGMMRANNADGTGIAGLHDHHDVSAANNVVNISENLAMFDAAWPLKRARLANDIYKDLTDLMVHLAPAVHSVGLLPLDPVPEQSPTNYRAFYEAMKRAQAAPVNTAQYWRAIDVAKAEYSEMLVDVQGQLRAENGAFLHLLSGRWLALQTVAPRLSVDSPSAEVRKKGGTHGPPCRA